jgi:hypothetical protein
VGLDVDPEFEPWEQKNIQIKKNYKMQVYVQLAQWHHYCRSFICELEKEDQESVWKKND